MLSGGTDALASSLDSERVPFVGCASDGQVGPGPAPRDNGTAPSVSQSEAKDLAYYAGAEIGVLAPRGWYCLALSGSNGTSLIVTPERHRAQDLLAAKTPLSGPAIQISLSDGGTSGRFEVAQVAARLFPSQSAFVKRIVAEGTEPATEFPTGPYPHDVMRARTAKTVEFVTPARQQGMGTSNRLVANDDPIVGLAIMPVDQYNSVVVVNVRLPSESRQLTGTILAQSQHRYDPVQMVGADPTVDQIYEASQTGHLAQAQRMVEQVLRDHPDSWKAHYVQAELYAQENHRNLARFELARAEQIQPGLPKANPQAVRALRAELGLAAD